MKASFIVLGLLVNAVAAFAVPINYTFDLVTPAGPGATLTISANEDASVQIALSALVGTVQIDANGAGVISAVANPLDITSGERLIITPTVGTFVGPYTIVSAVFGNVDTGGGASGDQAVVYVNGVAGSTITLPVSPTAFNLNTGFTSTIGFQGNDGNDDFRVTRVVITGEKAVIEPPPPTGVPEPATWTLLGFGIAGLAWMRRRRQK